MIEDFMTALFMESLDYLIPKVLPAVKQQFNNAIISDMHQKTLRCLASKDTLNGDDIAIATLAMNYGKDGEFKNPFKDEDDRNDDMVKDYADNLRNYLYTYKESAKDIDPSIDPNEYHKGPMAQDIEKVAPDCVKETSNGTKVVDGNRLALVNAGVIGDLARRLLELEAKVG